MIDKRFIFTVTTGRTGTLFLTNLLPIFNGVTATHEPEPSFVHYLRESQANPQIAKDFLINEKVPAIMRTLDTPIYIETSHLFCKGFLEPWLEIEELPTPDLILLNRDLREISLSYLSLNAIPGKSEDGLNYLIAPSDPTCFTRLDGWEHLNDYQLCYWYCLEIEERKKRYAEMIAQRGGRSLSTSIERVKTVAGILEVRRKLNFAPLSPHGWASFFKRRQEHLNVKGKTKKKVEIDTQQIAEWETEVKARTTVIK